jgi:hypothetical protein
MSTPEGDRTIEWSGEKMDAVNKGVCAATTAMSVTS